MNSPNVTSIVVTPEVFIDQMKKGISRALPDGNEGSFLREILLGQLDTLKDLISAAKPANDPAAVEILND